MTVPIFSACSNSIYNLEFGERIDKIAFILAIFVVVKK